MEGCVISEHGSNFFMSHTIYAVFDNLEAQEQKRKTRGVSLVIDFEGILRKVV